MDSQSVLGLKRPRDLKINRAGRQSSMRGVVIAEFLVASVFLIVFMIGVFQLCFWWYEWVLLDEVTERVVRWSATGQTLAPLGRVDSVAQMVYTEGGGKGMTIDSTVPNPVVTICPLDENTGLCRACTGDACAGGPSELVMLQINYTHRNFFPLFPLIQSTGRAFIRNEPF